MALDIIRGDAKMGNGGALSLRGYGRLKSRFVTFLKAIWAAGKDIVLIAHMDETTKNDETHERIIAAGASKQEIYRVADAIGRIKITNGKHVLSFDPIETAFGKNPGLPEYILPHPSRMGPLMADDHQGNQAASERPRRRRRGRGTATARTDRPRGRVQENRSVHARWRPP